MMVSIFQARDKLQLWKEISCESQKQVKKFSKHWEWKQAESRKMMILSANDGISG